VKFTDLGLAPEILRAVHDAGYTEPTPIQAQAIPIVLAGQDVMGGAQTGTGKTAGFTLPLLHKLARHANSSPSPARHPVRALILTPTRELAMQVEESVKTYSKHLALRSVCIYGGVDMRAQIAELKEGREIVVATPGRLLDHVEQKTVSFNFVEFLVLDEADRMLDMGFIPDIKRILKLLPTTRQSLLFSATFSDEIKKLADAMLKQPQLIEVARRNQVSETITHRVHPVASDRKRYLLKQMLEDPSMTQVLVFVGTKFGTSRLATWLEREGINATAIHGDKSQQDRTKALEAFKSGAARVLVATDVAARGLDIDDLPHVINYELPRVAEDYVHRIGRTGRAGKKGEATSLVAPEEKPRLAEIEKLTKFKIEQVIVPGFEPGSTAPPEERSERPDREGRGHGHKRESRVGHGPKAPVDHLPAPAAHVPRLPRKPVIAADGFDFSKPYAPKEGSGEAAPAEKSALAGRHEERHPKRPLRPVAALLGGLGSLGGTGKK
jgi:ATP-dependent RNA helicase RhlE